MASRRDRAPARDVDVSTQPLSEEEGVEPGEEAFDRPIPQAPPADNWFARMTEGAGAGQGDPWGNPNPSVDPAKQRVELTAPLAVCEVAGATQWWVERKNPLDGSADAMGTVHLDITFPEFVKRFLPSMPLQGQDQATFYLWPLDKSGTKLGVASRPYAMFNIPWDNVILRQLREVHAGSSAPVAPPGPSAESVALKMLQEQLAAERAERAREREEARALSRQAAEEREKAIEARLSHANMMAGDMSAAFQRINEAQQGGFASVLKTKEELDREERDRRREEVKEERERLREERQLERDRLRIEAEERMERIKAEAQEKVRQAEIAAELRKEELKLEAERMRQEAAREESRRQDERAREEERRRVDQEREDARREREEARDREHRLAMEKIREDSMARQDNLAAAERERQREHMGLLVGILEKKEAAFASPASKFGVIGELLDTLGMTPGEAIEKAKGLLGGGGGGIVETLISEVGQTVRDVVKRLPAVDDDEEEEEEEEEEEPEEANEPRQPRAPADASPKLDAFLRPSQEVPALPGPTLPAAPVVPLAAAKAGREAVALLVERLEAADATAWPQTAAVIIRDNPAIPDFIRQVGLRAALEGYEVDVERVGSVLDGLGTFSGPAPREAAVPVTVGGAS